MAMSHAWSVQFCGRMHKSSPLHRSIPAFCRCLLKIIRFLLVQDRIPIFEEERTDALQAETLPIFETIFKPLFARAVSARRCLWSSIRSVLASYVLWGISLVSAARTWQGRWRCEAPWAWESRRTTAAGAVTLQIVQYDRLRLICQSIALQALLGNDRCHRYNDMWTDHQKSLLDLSSFFSLESTSVYLRNGFYSNTLIAFQIALHMTL